MGKGSKDRVRNLDEFRKNYEEIFGTKEPKTWKPSAEEDPRQSIKETQEQRSLDLSLDYQ